MNKKSNNELSCLTIISAFIAAIIIVLVMAFVFRLYPTEPLNINFNYNELISEVVDVDLIEYDFSDVKIVQTEEEIQQFDFEKVEIIEKLKIDIRNDFLYDLSQIVFHECDDITGYFNSACGTCIRITYLNGDFVILCYNSQGNFVVKYIMNGSVGDLVARFIGENNFIDLVNEYFETQIQDI